MDSSGSVEDRARQAVLSSQVYTNGIEGVVVDGPSLGDATTLSSILYAKLLLAAVPNPADYDLDGLIALAIVEAATVKEGRTGNRRKKQDQWKYAETDDPSYYTLGSVSRALRSDTTVRVDGLDASKTHFMMFKSGISKVDTFRFQFTNPTDYKVDPDGNPAVVDDDFFELCGLPDWDTLTCDVLKVHAQRLEAIQHALVDGVIAGREEKHTQLLFEHFLGELVKALPGGDSYRVGSVAGMESVKVAVEVSNAYLAAQKKQIVKGSTGKQVILTAESDVVVIDASSNRDLTNEKENFLNCSYNIEMKDAGVLKNSATKPKSQLLAEALAKHLQLKDNTNHPDVIYSVLCDGYSLCIMIHFTQEHTAFLSHREIEPGRMVVMLAWLHRLATSNTSLTSSAFRDMPVILVGSRMEDEIDSCLQKKRSPTGGGGGGKQRSRKQKATASSSSNNNDEPYKKRLAAAQGPEDAEFCLDLPACDRMEREEETARQLSMFSAFRNYHSFSDPLPATEGIVHMMEKRNEGAVMSQYEDRLARFDASKA
jgi:hypothetical protein